MVAFNNLLKISYSYKKIQILIICVQIIQKVQTSWLNFAHFVEILRTIKIIKNINICVKNGKYR